MSKQTIVLERVYEATLEELWALWTTKQGFESWWGPVGFRVEVSAIDARQGGELRYAMIADTPEMVAAMERMHRAASHSVRATFSEVRPFERLVLTNVVDFVPGVAPYENDIDVDFFRERDGVRMRVTLHAMHDETMTNMQRQGFSSQLEKLDARYRRHATAARIFPHLWYAKDAEAAARLYVSLFPDSSVDRVTTMPSDSPSGPAGSVSIVDFTLFGQRFQAMSAGPHHDFNDAISLVVLCDSQAELDRYWSALLEGGGKEQACGWLIDRFGVRWQIVPARLDAMMSDPDRARAKRVTDALLKMVKLDLAALEAAYA